MKVRIINVSECTDFWSSVRRVGYQHTFSFGHNLVFTRCQPWAHSFDSELIGCGLRNMNTSGNTVTFHATGCIHGIAKQLKAASFTPKDTGRGWTRLKMWDRTTMCESRDDIISVKFKHGTRYGRWKTYVQTNSHLQFARVLAKFMRKFVHQ